MDSKRRRRLRRWTTLPPQHSTKWQPAHFLLFMVFFVFAAMLLILSMFKPSFHSTSFREKQENIRFSSRHFLNGGKHELGRFGKILVGMLPDELPFTVFVPSENSFLQILQPHAKEEADATDSDDTAYNSSSSSVNAIISRILGFSAVPEKVTSSALPLGGETVKYSISGFKLHILRTANGALLVNNVMTDTMDLRIGEIVVHVVNGVLTDAEFEQSIMPEDEEEGNSD
eukprot:TRINITY_DN2776_c0_g1_i2.p1 TRINITY_DN2776_c0_g1~~TRINITY_DN2776_c0_g1_i2.p1  ORF type:complete len:229 (-),score=15.22 TRINITY_DN2776_c0_g1_i2:405-1091(-)